jgi:hypothetical protein
MTSVGLATERVVDDAMRDVKRRVVDSGLVISPDALPELSDLVDAGFRELVAQRLLDRQDARAADAIARARKNLFVFVDQWAELERARGSQELTLGGFTRARASLCPVWPFSTA